MMPRMPLPLMLLSRHTPIAIDTPHAAMRAAAAPPLLPSMMPRCRFDFRCR